MISENRTELFDNIARDRTRHITIVLEDIYQSQNASAVLRTCDIVGIQDVHIVEKRNSYQVNKDVSLGSSKWTTLHRYREFKSPIEQCASTLKKNGYTLIATSPQTENSVSLNEISLDIPIAIMFGTELTGLSDEAIEFADKKMHVPMYGFTESYNISVCAAIVMYTLKQRMHETRSNNFLNHEEQVAVKIAWAKEMLRNADKVEEHLRARHSKK